MTMKKQNYQFKLFVAAVLLTSAFSMPLCAGADTPGVEAACRSSSEDNETVKFLLVWDRSGGCAAFPIEDHPCIISSVEDMEIRCVTEKEEVTFSMNEVHKYTLDASDEHASAVETIEKDDATFRRTPGAIEFYGYEPRTKVNVYNIGGVMTGSHSIGDDGCLSLSTAEWGSGVYVIRVGKTTFKILKK